MRATAIRDNKPVISEKTFQAQVIKLARYYGWMVAHFRPAMTQRGRWVTAVQGDGAGFPDCVLLRRGRTILAELKSAKGIVTPEQQKWLDAGEAAHLEVYVWRPDDYDEIVGILK